MPVSPSIWMVSQDLLELLLISAVMKDNNRQDFGDKRLLGIKNKSFLTLLSSKKEIMKIFLLALILSVSLEGPAIYDFKVPGLDGTPIDFSAYKGKKIMIVNTASKCGNTPQYAELEKLYEKYKNKLVIVGFPANNFGEQEPGSNTEIQEFCKKNYGVTFPMAEKVSVRGDDTTSSVQMAGGSIKRISEECTIR